ncbi:MAG: cytochrome c biogenesis CcdA family protein [Candidatus Magasanikbacteria bacterium]
MIGEIPLVIAAFIAGLLTFLAPCTLPLIPGYLAFISGTSLEKLSSQPEKARSKILMNGFSYVLGFSIVFTLLGVLAGFIGSTLSIYRGILTKVAGIFVILFGLFMMKILKIPFLRHKVKFSPPDFFKKGNPKNSFLLGVSFAIGWTPCIGPILGSIFTLASTSSTIVQGTLLLMVFSAGLAVPFMLVAYFLARANEFIKDVSKYLNIVSIIGGAFLVFLGILLVTNNMVLLINYGFELLEFLNYDELLRLL